MTPKPWDIIANYESHELVRARYHAKHGREPNAAHAREIASAFIQARQYYAAAATADRAVKPLLLYYGIVSLSHGLVLFLTRGLREAALAQAHGLAVREWQTVLAVANPTAAALQIQVNASGSFVELLRATNNTNLVRANSSAVNARFAQGPVEAGTVFCLGDLLARLPDVLDQFQRWQTPRCVRVNTRKSEGSAEMDVTVYRSAGPYIDENLVIDIVGRKHCELISKDKEKIVVRTTQGDATPAIVTDYIADRLLGIGHIFLAQQYPSGIRLSKITQLFAISYVLGMVVRYHPSFWMNLVHQRISDAALPSILRTIDCLENLFPQIVVDFLEE